MSADPVKNNDCAAAFWWVLDGHASPFWNPKETQCGAKTGTADLLPKRSAEC
jgi:hypothetical protein